MTHARRQLTEPPPLPTWKRQLPLGGVLVLVALGLLVMLVAGEPAGYRIGSCVVAAGLVLGAVLRAALPVRRAGLLVVRSRPFDVVLLAGCAAGLVVLALSLPPGS